MKNQSLRIFDQSFACIIYCKLLTISLEAWNNLICFWSRPNFYSVRVTRKTRSGFYSRANYKKLLILYVHSFMSALADLPIYVDECWQRLFAHCYFLLVLFEGVKSCSLISRFFYLTWFSNLRYLRCLIFDPQSSIIIFLERVDIFLWTNLFLTLAAKSISSIKISIFNPIILSKGETGIRIIGIFKDFLGFSWFFGIFWGEANQNIIFVSAI